MFTSPRQDQGAAISDFMLLRNSVERGGAAPPLVPTLKSETDTSYFDDFDDPADMEMYKDVKNRQEALEREVEIRNLKEAKVVDGSSSNSSGLRTAFIGFTYKHRAGNKTLL